MRQAKCLLFLKRWVDGFQVVMLIAIHFGYVLQVALRAATRFLDCSTESTFIASTVSCEVSVARFEEADIPRPLGSADAVCVAVRFCCLCCCCCIGSSRAVPADTSSSLVACFVRFACSLRYFNQLWLARNHRTK